MTPVEWVLLGLAVVNIITGVALKLRANQIKNVSTGLAILEAVIEENKLADRGGIGKQITDTIKALGPVAVNAVNLARNVKAAFLKSKELGLIRQEGIERAVELAARKRKLAELEAGS